jgi:hypothetical protein
MLRCKCAQMHVAPNRRSISTGSCACCVRRACTHAHAMLLAGRRPSAGRPAFALALVLPGPPPACLSSLLHRACVCVCVCMCVLCVCMCVPLCALPLLSADPSQSAVGPAVDRPARPAGRRPARPVRLLSVCPVASFPVLKTELCLGCFSPTSAPVYPPARLRFALRRPLLARPALRRPSAPIRLAL